MKYQVLHTFIDPADGCRLYQAGGTFPGDGYSPAPEHLRHLDGSEGRPALIAPVPEEAPKTPEKPAPARKGSKKGG